MFFFLRGYTNRPSKSVFVHGAKHLGRRLRKISNSLYEVGNTPPVISRRSLVLFLLCLLQSARAARVCASMPNLFAQASTRKANELWSLLFRRQSTLSRSRLLHCLWKHVGREFLLQFQLVCRQSRLSRVATTVSQSTLADLDW